MIARSSVILLLPLSQIAIAQIPPFLPISVTLQCGHEISLMVVFIQLIHTYIHI